MLSSRASERVKPLLRRSMVGGPTAEKIEVSRSSCVLTMYVRSSLGGVLTCLSDIFASQDRNIIEFAAS